MLREVGTSNAPQTLSTLKSAGAASDESWSRAQAEIGAEHPAFAALGIALFLGPPSAS